MATMECGLGDVGELYRSSSKSLERMVRFGVQAPEPVIEEACQVAWSRLVFHQHRVNRDTAFGWLVRTASREAIRLLRRGSRELPFDSAEAAAAADRVMVEPGPDELAESRARLAMLSLLPLRQQRLLWLRGLGLSYDEIALRDGCTKRTVERQLLQARTALRAAD
ncbi:MAG TPA: sigma factor-like helix-turn-helix DNA-binding protein [Solirubrobacteraceae bacterium]|nr:sigma factor-like helix-turn-helix DNA-binding protein [Solirubrobacteraceae bacterium]